MNKKDLTRLFNQFAGKALKDPKRLTKDADMTIVQMQKVAKDNGLRLRVWFPESMGTMDFRTDRVNAHVVKAKDGTYRVTKKFNIG